MSFDKIKAKKLAAFCSAMGSQDRQLVLYMLALESQCTKQKVIEVEGKSQYSVFTALRLLKKTGFINGNLTSKQLHYCIDYDKLQECKALFNLFFDELLKNKEMVNGANVSCAQIR